MKKTKYLSVAIEELRMFTEWGIIMKLKVASQLESKAAIVK